MTNFQLPISNDQLKVITKSMRLMREEFNRNALPAAEVCKRAINSIRHFGITVGQIRINNNDKRK